MDFWRKTQGAVSIFLVIILVPMMTVSALFVDAAKVKLARGVMESAGDLTLNTALTDYDTQLKDLYGLFGTAQDTEDLYNKLEDYYRTCIVSSGVDEDSADSFVDSIMAQLGLVGDSNDAADILNINLMDFSAQKVNYATLANATVMKKQLVEFMKYRGPINTGLGFLSALQSFSTLSKQTELVDKRQEYYEKQEDVMKSLKEAWKHINEYEKLAVVTDDNYFANMKANMNGDYQTKYQEHNQKTIKDLYDTESYAQFDLRVDEGIDVHGKDITGGDVTRTVWRYTYYGSAANTYIDAPIFNTYSKTNLPTLENLKSHITAYYNAAYNLDVNYPTLRSYMSKAPAGAYELQYLVQAARSHDLRTTASDGLNLYLAYQRLQAAMEWLAAYEAEEGNELKNEDVQAQDATKRTLTISVQNHFNNITSDYENRMRTLQQIGNVFRPISQHISDASQTNPGGVGNSVHSIGTTVAGYRDTMDAAAQHLETAKQHLQDAYDSVNGGDLSQARENWSTLANDPALKNTSMGKQDKAEIEETRKYLNTEDLQKFINRITNVAQNLRKSADQIEGYRFDNTFIGDIQNYKALESVIEGYVTASALHSVPLNETELNNFCTSHFKWESGNLNVDWVNQPGTQVKLHGTGTDKLNFYSYLFTHFNEGPIENHGTTLKTENQSEGQNKYDNIKKNADSGAKKQVDDSSSGLTPGSDITGSNLPSVLKDGAGGAGTGGAPGTDKLETGNKAAKNTSGTLNSMFKVLGEKTKKAGTDLYEKLLISDYVLSMFSYDTIEAEWKVNHADDSDSKPETLTRVPIDAEHNLAYGREVEYVVYGGSNSENVTKAYASIYGVRLGFNLIYAFTDSEIRETAFAIATPISAATLGVVPVPLIQAAIIVGVACVESGLDLAMLKSGEKVALFKNKETWRTSISGLVDTSAQLVKKAASEAIDATTTKITEFLDMTDEQLTENIGQKEQELQQYLGNAYDTLIERQANTAIQQLTAYATQAVDEAALTGQNAVNQVNEKLREWANESGGSGLAGQAKREAVEYIINKGYAEKVVQQIEQAAGGQVDGVQQKLDQILGDLRSKMLDTVVQGSDAIQQAKTNMINEAKSSLKEGADSLKSTLNEQFDGVFGGDVATGDDDAGLASVLSFSYSDYLRLFLMIGLYTNQAGVLLRTADVVQVNMAKTTGDTGYELHKAAAYVQVEATVQVPPTLLALPLFADVKGNPYGNAGWYTLSYDGIQGY